MPDTLIQLLAKLPTAEPDAGRSERIKMCCRVRLARQAARTSASRIRPANIWPPLVVLLGVAYLIEAIVQALGLYGLP